MTLFNNKELENIPIRDGALDFAPTFLAPNDANMLFESLKNTLQWQQHHIKLFGKTHASPRLSAWYGDAQANYSYSGLALTPLAFTPDLQELRVHLEKTCNTTFNSVLANRYRNGNDSMGWHADDEKSLGVNPKIASINLGATRTFLLKHKDDKSLKYKIELTHGSLLFMHGALQHYWLHSIPKTQKSVAERINLTFRNVMI